MTEWDISKAKAWGVNAAENYREEFGESPSRVEMGDWDTTAWQAPWSTLKSEGADEEDYDAYLSAWRSGFFGVTASL